MLRVTNQNPHRGAVFATRRVRNKVHGTVTLVREAGGVERQPRLAEYAVVRTTLRRAHEEVMIKILPSELNGRVTAAAYEGDRVTTYASQSPARTVSVHRQLRLLPDPTINQIQLRTAVNQERANLVSKNP